MGTPDTDLSDAKATARAEARARRRSGDRPDPAALAGQTMALVESTPGPRRVTCYASYGTEPDTGEVRRRLMAAGYEVLLPRVTGPALEWVVDGGESQVSSMGIAEPIGDSVELLPVRAMIIPALAVTRAGDRLGKGGGFYDRVLTALGDARPLIAAIVGEQDLVDSLPTEPHDARVDAIITPTRIFTCA